MQFYDMHTHIMPKIDDGAKSVEASIALLENLKSQGVTKVCLTPHFYSHHRSVESFVARRSEAAKRLDGKIPSGMNIVIGAEVYVTQFLMGNDDFSGLAYGKSNYMLTEFDYNSDFSDNTVDDILKIMERGFTPILPHVERYKVLMDNPDIIALLRKTGILIQTNTLSLSKKMSVLKKRKLVKLIDKGLIDILGTDTHSFEHNPPETYTQALEYISAKCGNSAVDRLMDNAKMIFDSAI